MHLGSIFITFEGFITFVCQLLLWLQQCLEKSVYIVSERELARLNKIVKALISYLITNVVLFEPLLLDRGPRKQSIPFKHEYSSELFFFLLGIHLETK